MKEKEDTGELVDLHYLLRLLGGKKEQARQIVQLFVEHAPSAISEMRVLYQEQNWPVMKAKVHAIKSYYGYLGKGTLLQKLEEWEIHLSNALDSFDHGLMLEELADVTAAIVIRLKEVLDKELREI